ncbi:hypothetical protein BGX28_003628 [Mortierella sp. GBA30]|nr:hypothetical protein BGX28_003628 [Mortierella sp. GBA30]
MLNQFTPRVALHARQFLRGSAVTGAFPRRPVFFSTAARSFSKAEQPAERSGASTASADINGAAVDAAGATTGAEPEATPTNLDNPPDAISCTVAPPPTYAFLKPTPVVLLTGPFGGNWCFRDTWQASLADQGYQSTSIELAMPHQRLDSGDAYIRHFVKVLKTSIETDHSFYPPILIAHGLHALVAQKYVESNPVSALVLVSPFIPEIIKGRFQELSQKLQIKNSAFATMAAAATTSTDSTTALEEQQKPEVKFETHADVMAQEGFRETYVLPKKAVYKIDLVAKEIQEKAKEKEQKEKEVLHTKEEDIQQKEHKTSVDASSTSAATRSTPIETLGKDSVPVGESPADTESNGETALDKHQEEVRAETTSAESKMRTKSEKEDDDTAILPEQTAETEASIHSPLEQLPLAIYDSIPTSEFEPTFPILLVTSNADEIVSTADVKEHHILAKEVDHIELEDLDDGGHLIMVSDNTEWEQGIQGITAWLDSNGM